MKLVNIDRNLIQKEIFFPSSFQSNFFIDQKNRFLCCPKKKATKTQEERRTKYISARHKANHKCCSRMRLNILGFLYLSLFFFPPFLVHKYTTKRKKIKILPIWKMIFWLSQQWQLCEVRDEWVSERENKMWSVSFFNW